MAKVPKGQTIYTRGKTYKSGQDAPDDLVTAPVKQPPKPKEPKKDK
jgi:hypothetical protein